MILITGALSDKGLNLLKSLPQGAAIAFDNLSCGFEKKSLLPENTEFIFGDVRDDVMIKRVIKDKDIQKIYHFAKVADDKSLESFEVNLGARLKLQKLSEELQIELVV